MGRQTWFGSGSLLHVLQLHQTTHESLANLYPRTPAMATRISDHIWTVEEIVSLSIPR